MEAHYAGCIQPLVKPSLSSAAGFVAQSVQFALWVGQHALSQQGGGASLAGLANS